MTRIAILTSGGDAPGMNAAIRASVRSAVHRGWDCLGICYGFQGLLDDDFIALGARDVGGVIHLGGTFLGSSRCEEFLEPAGQAAAIEHLRRREVDHLLVIGGNGSQQGAYALHRQGVSVVGIASTIDNDLVGTDVTVGADTALNVALESVDRLRTTAVSHRRVVLVEVMGRDCGYIALMTAIAGGAEAVVVPEDELDPEALIREIGEAHVRKGHALVVVAEGSAMSATELAEYMQGYEGLKFKLRVTVLGHVQRGGVPTAFDRLLASRFGAGAIEAIADGETGVLIGLSDGAVSRVPLAECAGKLKHPDEKQLALAEILAR